eukprot:6110544-Amphidinium_carterae.3
MIPMASLREEFQQSFKRKGQSHQVGNQSRLVDCAPLSHTCKEEEHTNPSSRACHRAGRQQRPTSPTAELGGGGCCDTQTSIRRRREGVPPSQQLHHWEATRCTVTWATWQLCVY